MAGKSHGEQIVLFRLDQNGVWHPQEGMWEAPDGAGQGHHVLGVPSEPGHIFQLNIPFEGTQGMASELCPMQTKGH